MKKYTIYQITNTINGNIYIGKHETYDLDDGYMGSGKVLKTAQIKYGLENFTKQILHVFGSEEQMNSKEAELVSEEFCLREDTYNLCPGGKGGWGYLNSITPKAEFAERGKLGGKRNKGNKNSSLKKMHDSGKLTHLYFNNKENFKELYTAGLHAAKSVESLQKRKSSYKEIKHAQGTNNSQYGTLWITNGVINKKIKKTEPIPEGWEKGRNLKAVL